MTQLSLIPATPEYHPLPGVWDEMWDADAGVRPHWTHLVRGLAGLGAREWSARGQRIARLLRENGVTYHVYDDPRGYTRTWELDPIPLVLDGHEWLAIQAGLEQRARLLDLVLRDLLGPRALIDRGLLPPELIWAHGGYQWPLLGGRPADRRQLVFYAADLARGPDGRVWVMADRAQAPSGVGYALENRAAMARTFPELLEDAGVAKLTHWLAAAQDTLYRLAPAGRDDPHVVVLTPGPANETYFEHAYLAARLGFSLAQGDDLTVRDGRVWLKAVAGLKPVDVILRRVDETWCDPLELRPDSRLGSAGLVEAARRGNVTLANPLGAGLLENPGLMPFLPALSQALLGEELKLPTAATWWCGQPKERDYVLANLHQLVLKPIQRGHLGQTVFGALLDRKQLAAWRERIQAQPHLWVGQQPLTLSTVPAAHGGRLQAHHMSLRAFLVSHGDGYATLPGGLTRVVRRPDQGDPLSGQSGALAKDTWVTPSPPRARAESLPGGRREAFADVRALLDKGDEILTSRAADNLFWAGRYLERAEVVARLLRTVLDGLWEEETTPGLAPVLHALMRAIGRAPGQCGCAEHPDLAACVRDLVTHDEGPGNLVHSVRALLACTYGTREYWSVAIWRLLDRIERDWGRRRHGRSPERTDLWLGRLIDALAGLAGLASETLPREAAFRFFDLGRRIERGLNLVTLLGQSLHARLDEEAERESLALLLQSADSLITYRRRFRAEPGLAGVLALLVWDHDCPRALAYQLRAAGHHLAELDPDRRRPRPRALLTEADNLLRLAQVGMPAQVHDAAGRARLADTLAEVARHLAEVSDGIGQAWFAHVQEPQSLRPVWRARASA